MVEVVTDFHFLGSKITADSGSHHEIRRWLHLGRKATTNLDSMLKSRHYLVNKSPDCQGCGLPSGHVWLWEMDLKEGRTPKNWCLQTVVLEKTTESPLDSKQIKPVDFKGNQTWIFTGRTDTEAEAPVFLSSEVNRRLIGKVPDAGKNWGPKEERASEDEMTGWQHLLNEHEFGQILGDGEGQGAQVCCSPGRKEPDMTGWRNKNNNNLLSILPNNPWFISFSTMVGVKRSYNIPYVCFRICLL